MPKVGGELLTVSLPADGKKGHALIQRLVETSQRALGVFLFHWLPTSECSLWPLFILFLSSLCRRLIPLGDIAIMQPHTELGSATIKEPGQETCPPRRVPPEP